MMSLPVLFLLALTSAGLATDEDAGYQRSEYRFLPEGSRGLEFRSVPMLGFFPMGGSATMDSTQMSTHVLGVSLDLATWHFPQNKFSLLNTSAYLFGVDWTSLMSKDDTDFIEWAYLRAGPHFRFEEMGWSSPDGNKHFTAGSLGFQAGYGFFLQGDLSDLNTAFAHGLDLSITFSYGEYKRPETLAKEPIVDVEPLDDRARVSWIEPRGTAPIVGYKVAWREGQDYIALDYCPESYVVASYPSDQTQAFIEDLDQGEPYTFRICAVFEDGTVSRGGGRIVQSTDWPVDKPVGPEPPPGNGDAPPRNPERQVRFSYGVALGSLSEVMFGVEITESVIRRVQISGGMGLLVLDEWGYHTATSYTPAGPFAVKSVYGVVPAWLVVGIAPWVNGPFEVDIFAGPGINTSLGLPETVYMSEGLALALHRRGGHLMGSLGVALIHTQGSERLSSGSEYNYSDGLVPVANIGWMFD